MWQTEANHWDDSHANILIDKTTSVSDFHFNDNSDLKANSDWSSFNFHSVSDSSSYESDIDLDSNTVSDSDFWLTGFKTIQVILYRKL